MKETLKTAIISLSLLLITSLVITKEAKAEENQSKLMTPIPSPNNSGSDKDNQIQNTQIDFKTLKVKKIDGSFATEKELRRQQELVDKLNESQPAGVYVAYENKLTKEEWKERLKFLQSLEKYSLKWYYDYMTKFRPDESNEFYYGFRPDECGDATFKPNPRCYPILLLHQLNVDQVVSIFLHFNEINCNPEVNEIVKIILHSGVHIYVYSRIGHDMSEIASIDRSEITALQKQKLILNKYRENYSNTATCK
jgi:hypothetical protein